MTPLIVGILFTLAVFPGLGPQNLNILSHAIKKNHHYAVATTCVLADILLIILGTTGLKLFNSKIIVLLINILGIIFIFFYVLVKIKNLFNWHKNYRITSQIDTKKTSIIRALALTWLNPLVFLDTIVIIGGVSSHYYHLDWFYFTLGSITGDIIWIYSLTFISSKFAYKLNNQRFWLILDSFTICMMIFILYKTILLVIK
ncbi:MAG: LysE/ArgO family amino acid transporter [Neisseriaceae bacterium]